MHAIAPRGCDDGHVQGLASITFDANDAKSSDVQSFMQAAEDEDPADDEEYPPRVIFLSLIPGPVQGFDVEPALQTIKQLCHPGHGVPGAPASYRTGVAVEADCNASEWTDVVRMVEAAKERGLLVKALLRGATEVEPHEVSYASAILADAGVDVLSASLHTS
eukprot:SAG31_NODE_20894_length_563_cov_0.668103_1_plen_163_part_00